VLNDNGGNGRTNVKRVNELTKSEKDDIYQKIDTIQAILERFPLVMFHIVRSGQSINNLNSILDSEHYVPVTFDDDRIIDKALEYGIIDRKSLSYRINQAGVDVQHAVNKDDVNALYELSRSPHTQVGIPVDLFEDMLSV
jgi:Ca2+-dependent lipid-binding protein